MLRELNSNTQKDVFFPHLDLNLSDQAPTKGSDIASKTKEIPKAVDARTALRPRTWL